MAVPPPIRTPHASAAPAITATPADLVVRSPVIAWIFLIAAAVSLASGVLTLPQVLSRPTVAGSMIVAACGLYGVLCLWCWNERRRSGRSVMAVAVFAGATITFIAAAAVPQRVGVNTVGFMVLPAFLFMITVLGHQRLSLGMSAYTGLLWAGVSLHHLLQLTTLEARSGAAAVALIVASLILTFALLGHHIAQVMNRQVQESRATALRYRALFDRLPVGAVLVQGEHIIEYNEAAERMIGGTERGALLGTEFMRLMPEGERAATYTRMRQAQHLLPGEGLPLRDLEMRSLDGRIVPVSVTSVGVEQGSGLLLSLIMDRSREDEARRELRRTQRQLEGLFRASSHMMAVSDLRSGEFLLVNPACAAAAGLTPEEMIGRTSIELGMITEANRDAMLDAVSKTGEARDVPIRVKDRQGLAREQRHSLTATEFDGRAVLVAVGHDVTDETRRERELQTILAATPAAVYVIRHGRVTIASAEYERLLGLSPGQAYGRPYEADIGGPQAMAEIARRFNQALRAGEIVSYEHEVFRADGSTFPALMTGRLIEPGAPDGFGMVWVVEDLTEQRRREANLSRAKADAEAASRAKTGFLATMSHEIRTPLNGILGLMELVRDPQLPAAQRQQYLDLMNESAQSLQEIVSDVLDVSRIESGRLQIEPHAFELGPWLDTIRAVFQPLAEAKGLVLSVGVEAQDRGWVWGDSNRLRQILANYLSNALKFTLAGRIEVRVSRLSSDRMRLEVQDSGIGIEHAQLERLFQPYAQASGSDTRLRSSGLGLSICRQLAELMGGQTGASSHYGEGSSFWVEVDLPEAQAPESRADAAASEATLEGMRLLVVDDNRINLVVARQLLQRAGAVVDVAEGGQEALDAVDAAHAAGAPYQLVLMDVQMPEMDGLQALARLRTRPHGRGLCVLAASAAVTTEEVDLTRAAGFDGFVSKPLEVAVLVKAVADAVRRSSLSY